MTPPHRTAAPRTFAPATLPAAVEDPGATAFVDGPVRMTYADLDARRVAVAGALAAAGVVAGDRVAYLGAPARPFVELLCGAATLGAVAVAVNWRLSTREAAAVLADAAPRLVVAVPEWVQRFEDGLITGSVAAPAVVPLDAWTDRVAAAAPYPGPVVHEPDGVALQIYTSGTTGRPKGVLIGHDALARTMDGAVVEWGLHERSVVLGVLPVFHIAGLGSILGALHAGATVVFELEPSPARIVADIVLHRVTQTVLAPTLLSAVLDEAAATGADLSSLEQLAYGAAPITPSALRRVLELAPCDLLQVYGLTETTGFVCTLEPADHTEQGRRSGALGSCGRPIDDVELRLTDPVTGTAVADGEPGEIWVRSPRIMLGYAGAPQETAAAITPDGWFRTGDLARRDASGYVHLLDRLRDMIVSGGENVQPGEVEAVLAEHPAVREAAVVGAPHPRWGETPVAVVVADAGVNDAELIAFVRDRLAHFKCPTAVHRVEVLPRTPSGKILRRSLREPLWRTSS